MYEIGARAYRKKKWKLALDWLNLVHEGLGEENFLDNVDRYELYDYLSYAYFQVGEVRLYHYFVFIQ